MPLGVSVANSRCESAEVVWSRPGTSAEAMDERVVDEGLDSGAAESAEFADG